jgi:multicomponent Na+:H+ antiporter subunit F
MTDFLQVSGMVVLATVGLGLVRVKLGPTYADRMMAAQLLGSGSIAVLLLFGAATGTAAVVDVALTMALLAAFASTAFVHFAASKERQIGEGDEGA